MNSHRKIRYAVIGAGNIAQVAMLPAFAHATDSSELAAVISSDHDKREEMAKQYDVEWTGGYDELEAILRDAQVRAAYIALPNHLHREYTERCAAMGVHVLCEKPMAMTVSDCEAMIRATEAGGVKLMIAYRLHFEETNLRAMELARNGTIGAPRYFSSVFSHDVHPGDIRTKPETGGGALFDLGIYCVNAARNLFGDEPVEVSAFTEPRVGDVDEMTSALLRFPGGRHAQLTVHQGASDLSGLRLVGSTGDLRLEPAYDYKTALKLHLTVNGNTEERTFEKRDQFAPELVYFSRCITDNLEPEPSGFEGLADVRVLEAIVASARSGASVKLGPFDKLERPDMSQNIHKPPVEEPKPVNAPSPSR